MNCPNYRIFQNTNRRQYIPNQVSRSQSRNRRFNRQPIQQMQPSRSRQPNRNSPRMMRLNDLMPPLLRDESPVSDNENILATAPTTAPMTRSTTPVDALPQRRQFVSTAPTTDDTQPFNIDALTEKHQLYDVNSSNNNERLRLHLHSVVDNVEFDTDKLER